MLDYKRSWKVMEGYGRLWKVHWNTPEVQGADVADPLVPGHVEVLQVAEPRADRRHHLVTGEYLAFTGRLGDNRESGLPKK